MFQTARKQMQNLTVELFARDKNARRQLLNVALTATPPPSVEPSSPTRPSEPIPPPLPEPIPELVQILLAAEPSKILEVTFSF